MVKELIVKEDPKSPISEIFRTLRTNIQFMNNKNKLKSLLITSTLAGEGKSWISANLAVTFAQAGKKVIVLDADMRKGRQYRIFNISPRPGLSNYLSGVTDDDKKVDLADYIQETEVENLYVIPAGNIPPNPSELLVSESMINLLEKLKEICDIIIIDGPPTQLVTDSLILSRITDSTAIVAESNNTKKENLRRIIDNIQKVGGKVAGIILNKVQLSAKNYEQSYYYGSSSIMKKGKNTTTRAFVNRNDESWERKNRNTERARQLVNQNKSKEEIAVEKIEYTGKDTNNTERGEEENLDNSKIQVTEQGQLNIDRDEQYENNFEKNYQTKREVNILENNSGETQNLNTNELDEKTQDILRQVNEYIENERKKLY